MMRTIQLTCSRCNATMFLERDRGFTKLSCPYCGGSMKLLMDSDSVRIEEIRADTDRMSMEYSYRKHRDILNMEWAKQYGKAILIGIVVLFFIVMIVSSSIRNKDNIHVPFSSRDLNGKYYSDVQTMFRDAGFSNIEVESRADLWDGFLRNDQGNVGKIAQVTINGEEKFNKNATYSKYAQVRIWYHCYP